MDFTEFSIQTYSPVDSMSYGQFHNITYFICKAVNLPIFRHSSIVFGRLF